MIDLKKEHEVFAGHFGLPKSNENYPILQCGWLAWKIRAELAQAEIKDLKQQIAELHASRVSWVEYSQKIENGEFVLVPREPAKEMFRVFYDAFNLANKGNTAQNFKVAYKAMIEVVEKDHDQH